MKKGINSKATLFFHSTENDIVESGRWDERFRVREVPEEEQLFQHFISSVEHEKKDKDTSV